MNMQHLSLITLAALFLAGCRGEPVVEEVLRPVRFETVYQSGGERSRVFSGVTQAGMESRLSFKVAGTVESIAVNVGDIVEAGDEIARLDAGDYQLQMQQAQASLASARAQERNNQANYDRVRQLYESRTTSRNDLDASRAGFESASAQVKALEKQLELAQSQLSYTRLKAPIGGAIASVDAEVNENINAGATVVQLSSGSQLEVEIAIPGILIAQIREGDMVSVSSDAMPDKSFEGRVTEVGISSVGTATTFPVTARLLEKDTGLRPGIATEVMFNFRASDNRVRFLVPPFAVREDRQGRFVYVVEPSQEEGVGIARRRAVTIGEITDSGIEVFEGLVDGSRVVTAGVSKLEDGQRVRLETGEGSN